MKVLHLEITKCVECPFSFTCSTSLFLMCGHEKTVGKSVDGEGEKDIPKWCPL